VPGIGTGNSGIMLLGEAPGQDENQKGIPFVGRAGQFLRQKISLFYTGRFEDLYITNTVKCWPCTSDGKNRKPTPEEVLACSDWLELEIKNVLPSVIVPLGKTALRRIDGIGDISTNQGKAAWSEKYKAVIYAMYHPAFIIRNPKQSEAEFEDGALRLGAMLHRPWWEVQRWLTTTQNS